MTWDNEKIEIFPLRHPIKKVGLAKSKNGWRHLLKEIIVPPTNYFIELNDSVINGFEIRFNQLKKTISLKHENKNRDAVLKQFIHSFKQLNTTHQGIVAVCEKGIKTATSDNEIIKKHLFNDLDYLILEGDEVSNTMKLIIRKHFYEHKIRFNSWTPDQINSINTKRYSISDIKNLLSRNRLTALSIQNVHKFMWSVGNNIAQQIVIKQIHLIQQ